MWTPEVIMTEPEGDYAFRFRRIHTGCLTDFEVSPDSLVGTVASDSPRAPTAIYLLHFEP